MDLGAAFYKKTEENELVFGVSRVFGPGFTLKYEERESYNYPVDGWYWFDSEKDAREFFGIDVKDTDEASQAVALAESTARLLEEADPEMDTNAR